MKISQESLDGLVISVEKIYLRPTDIWLNWPLQYRYSLPSKFDLRGRKVAAAIVLTGIGIMLLGGLAK